LLFMTVDAQRLFSPQSAGEWLPPGSFPRVQQLLCNSDRTNHERLQLS
jgi:hypothetical protein